MSPGAATNHSSSSSSSSSRSPFSACSASSSSSSSSSSEMRLRCTGWVCETSSSDSHSGQLRISPSSTSSSSTSISAEHSGQRITCPASLLLFTLVAVRGPSPPPLAYYIPRRRKSTSSPDILLSTPPPRARRLRPMTSSREYPERPIVGVGGVIIHRGRTVLIRRGSEPLRGKWSIPGGSLELGETLEEGVARELLEETGLTVRVIELIEVFDRIYMENGAVGARDKKPRFHYVIV